MAFGEITGASTAELGQLKQEYLDSPLYLETERPFEEAFCLMPIGKQPEEYDGPQRYCQNRAKTNDDGSKAPFCRFHGGSFSSNPNLDNLDPLANMSHGFFLNRKHLMENFRDYEREFYEEVMYEWPEKYGIDFDEDPSAMEDMHALALAIIRDGRANDVINANRDLTTTKGNYGPDGSLLEREEQAHYLISEEQAQRRLVMKMKDELGISRKHRDEIGQAEDASRTVAGLVEGMADALDKSEHEYDPAAFEESEPENADESEN
ncbi:hypothetical protein [Halorubellus litoreus]|uniref:Uncharacterized protein n=1 Tax=Halorubellus litoreus TaxID=755308 RepID=A0ABD5VJ79_9EURY